MAVPCWSSCIIGISSSSFKRSSIMNASGALISSKFMPPKVGDIAFTVEINFSTSVSFTSISKTSISANILNNKPLPSITGFEASGPMSPNPKTAVPFDITATKLPLAVYLYTLSIFLFIDKQGSATPGEYAKERSLCEVYGFVGITSILPFLPELW